LEVPGAGSIARQQELEPLQRLDIVWNIVAPSGLVGAVIESSRHLLEVTVARSDSRPLADNGELGLTRSVVTVGEAISNARVPNEVCVSRYVEVQSLEAGKKASDILRGAKVDGDNQGSAGLQSLLATFFGRRHLSTFVCARHLGELEMTSRKVSMKS